MTRPPQIVGLAHVQLAMPRGQEDEARRFYSGVLGLTEIDKPAILAKRGGVWFTLGEQQLHLGVEDEFLPARKAHPAILVRSIDDLRARLVESGRSPVEDEQLVGFRRFYAADPFGNRLEFLERDQRETDKRKTSKGSVRFTEKQGQYLAFIDSYIRMFRHPPSERDMEYHFRVSPPSVHQMILTLERNGLISRVPGQARSIALLVPHDVIPTLRSSIEKSIK